jgi:hypothetical protein
MKNAYFILILLFTAATQSNVYSQYTLPTYKEGQRDTMELTEIYFVGTGDIQQNIAKTKDDIAATTGVGVIFWRIFGDKLNSMELQLEARISIASTVDTIFGKYIGNNFLNMRDFGSYVAAPLARGQSTTINTLWYFKDEERKGKPIDKIIDGFQVDFIAANQVFKDSVTSMQASILGLRAGVFHEFVPTLNRLKQGYSIRLGINYIFRGLRGDLGTGAPRSNDLRKSLLGGTSRIFHGPEFLLALKLKNLKAQASLPIIFPKRGGPTYGLTGTQFVTTISFIGGFPLSL